MLPHLTKTDRDRGWTEIEKRLWRKVPKPDVGNEKVKEMYHTLVRLTKHFFSVMNYNI
uniref:Myb-like domain-containing protein n=1 Tax=Physcomitrium patens TaxID=3218 RepID=A0A2K1KB88_PHYPA|nr:hypothetical protein PHYPA_010229 [Physcomitrium patens]